MATPNDVAQPQPPPSPVADPDRTHALLRELSASMGVAPDSKEGLAALQSFIRASSTTAHSATPAPLLDSTTTTAATPPDVPMEDTTPPVTERPTVDVIPQSAATSPVPASEGATVPLASIDVAMDEAPAPSSEGGAPTHLPNIVISLDPSQSDSSSSVPAPSPTPLDRSLSSTLTPTSSLARAQPPRNPMPNIPNDSPLASCAQLLDPRAGSWLDTKMEWHMFPPNWRLQYVPQDSEVGGSTVYPPIACSGCIEVRARAITCNPAEERVRLLPPSSSSSPIPDDSPHPSTSRTSSTPDDSALAIAFAIRDAIVAVVEAFDQTLEEHGLSSKAKGKRRKRD
ncbi:hypothetical protein EDD15DRAFT_2361952 [Pisolithus albus]|nr:hypothetical protein EDD15DRAFT_2361952 [Pisolithus albus]